MSAIAQVLANPVKPAEPEPQQSFRERKAAQLRSERGIQEAQEPNLPADPVESQPEHVRGLVVEDEPGQPDQVAEGQPQDPVEDGYPGPDLSAEPAPGADLEAGDQPASGETPESDGDDDGLSPDAVEWRDKAEKAEELRSSMERDYRQKTAKLADNRRELKSHLEDVAAQGQFYLNLAEQGVKQFEKVNWQDLQTRPEEYQRARLSFQQAMQNRDQLHGALQHAHQKMAQAREEHANQEAEVSRDVLKIAIPEWGPEIYGKLRTHAVSHLDYTAEEVDRITDSRHILLINESLARHTAAETLVSVRTKQGNGKAPAQGRNKGHPQRRNAQGQYQNSRKEAFDQPGHKPSFRAMMQDKLRAEREATQRFN